MPDPEDAASAIAKNAEPPVAGLLSRWGAGMVVGALAGALLGMLEALYVVIAQPLVFDDGAEAFRFSAITVGVLCGAGAIVGSLLALLVAGVFAVARGTSGDRIVDDKQVKNRVAITLTILAAPGAVAFAVLAFQGRRMQLLPAHQALAVLCALVAVALSFAVVRVLMRVAARLAGSTISMRGRVGLALVAVAVAVVLHIGNARILSRLYSFFHASLSLATALCLALAVASLLLRRGMRLGPKALIVVAALGLWSGRWGSRQLIWWPALRALAFENTEAESRTLTLASALHLTPRAVVPPPPRFAPPPPLAPPLPTGPRVTDGDFFLITVDAMRGDRLNPQHAPRLSAIAEQGVVFDHALSQVPHTSFSLTTLLTGKYAFSLAALGADLAAQETLADLFKRDRYKTAAFFPPSVFFIDHDRFAAVEAGAFHFEYVKDEFMDAPGRTDQVIRFLDGEHPERVFVWVHYFDPHEPYEPHPELVEAEVAARTMTDPAKATAVELYDGEVRFVDREVARLIDHIRSTRPRAVIAFSADHGEEFGEHGGRYHGSSLYEEQVHVPLFLVGPGIGNRHVSAPVGLVDLAPTLLAMADVVPPVRMRGHDLGPWLLPSTNATPSAANAPAPESRIPTAFAEVGAKKMLATGDERLICDLGRDYCELYDLAADPMEKHNLAGRKTERVAELKAQLQTWMAGHSTFEREPVHGDGSRSEKMLAALERCRLGDRGAAMEVAPLLLEEDVSLRDNAARALLRLSDEPAIGGAIRSAQKAHPQDLLLAALALRAGDASLVTPLRTIIGSDGQDVDPTVRAEVVLALIAMQQWAKPDAATQLSIVEKSAAKTTEKKDLLAITPRDAVRLLAPVLPMLNDEDVERRVIAALGLTRRHEALAPLVAELESVRVRPDVVEAMGVLSDRAAVPVLTARIADEPYVTARSAEAKALGRLGDRRAVSSLKRLLSTEQESEVKDEITAALAHLSAAH